MKSDKPPAVNKLHRNMINHAITLVQFILTGTQPADAQIHHLFRANKQLGARDRGFIAETVYGVLRQRRYLEFLLGSLSATPGLLVCSYLLGPAGYSARVLEDGGITEIDHISIRNLVEQIRTVDPQQMPLAARTNLPNWLFQKLLQHYGESETIHIAQGMNQPAALDLRVNTLKTTRDQAAQSLRDEGYDSSNTPYSPVGLRRNKRSPLNQTSAFKNGWIEVQDEGSQLLSLLVEPRAGETVVDFCAGAGGKTLHLGTLMQNRGSLYAFDVSEKRLQQFKPRLKRAGLDNVRSVVIQNENDVHVKRLRGKVDRVLVDAPCSGTGTLRRNPDIKWRHIDLESITQTQLSILKAAASLLKPSGRLVYATCSILPEENEEIISAFIQSNKEFTVIPVCNILSQLHIPLTMTTESLRLWPHQHGTDGFFAMVLQKL